MSQHQEQIGFHGMRILGFCDYFGSESSGGTERVAREVYARLASRGAQIQVVTIGKRGAASVRDIDGITVHDIPLVDLSPVFRAQVAFAPTLLRRVPSIIRGFVPHVLHANNLYFQTTLAAAMLQRFWSLPLVTTAHIGSLQHLPKPTRWLAQGYERTIGQLILKRSSRVIAVSQSVRNYLVGRGVNGNKIDVVHNGVDLQTFQPARTEIDGNGSTPLILFIGRLIGNKGPHILLEALFDLNRANIRFSAVFLGSGPMRRILEKRVLAKGLQSLITFAGHVEEPAPHLRNADVIVRPSFSEGMPLTVLEAMASRVCVVASDIPGNRDLIQNGRTGLLVRAGSAPDLATALALLIRDPWRRRELAAGGYQIAQGYSWAETAEGTANVLMTAGTAHRRDGSWVSKQAPK